MKQVVELSNDWQWIKLGDVGRIETGTTPSKSKAEYYGKDIPFFKPTDLQQGINTLIASDNLSKLGFEKTRKLPKDSILVTCIGATIGKTGLIKVEGASNQQINSIIPNKQHHPKFVFYQVISQRFQNSIKDNSSSTTLPILNKSKFQQLDFITTKFDSQSAIVAKIEELFSELDKGIENLLTAQQQLKTYRQSVLKWAFEGKLTNENVKEGELPNGWKSVMLGEVCKNVEYGSATKSKQDGKIPVLRMGNIQNGKFDWDDLVYTDDDDEIKKYLLKKDDVLFNRTNSAEWVGKTAIYKGEKPAIFAGYLIRINRIENLLDANFITYYLNSHQAKKFGNSVRSFGVNQSNINGTKLKTYPISLPPLKEQEKIVQEIESRLSVADKIEESITQSL